MSRKRHSTKVRRNPSARTAPRPAVPAARTVRDPAAVAAESEQLAQQYPQEREELLMEAAGEWAAAGNHQRALALYEELLGGECADAHLIESYRVNELWQLGRIDEAREAARQLRAQHPKDGGAWNTVAETLECAGEHGEAAEWFTAGISHLLVPTEPLTVESVEAGPAGFDVAMLLIGRHRVRRLLAQPHDTMDDLADRVHARGRLSPLIGGVRPLDELHDPARREAERGGEAELRGELNELRAHNDELTAEIAARSAALARPQVTPELYWPSVEFAQLRGWRPALAEAYGDDHAVHRRQVEQSLQQLSAEGGLHLGVTFGTVQGLLAFAREEGADPDVPDTRTAYAFDLAQLGRAVPWPPPRNAACWCGSGAKYKRCCGGPGEA